MDICIIISIMTYMCMSSIMNDTIKNIQGNRKIQSTISMEENNDNAN